MIERKKLTIREIAKEAGVGATTVSRYLDPRKRDEISGQIREKIDSACQKLGFDYKSIIRKRKLLTTGYTFGVMGSFSKDIFKSRYHTELLSGIFDEITRTSHELKLFLMQHQHYENLDEILRDHGLDGLLVLTWRIHPNVVRLVQEENAGKLPLVIFNDYDPNIKVNIVYTDVREGTRQAVNYLFDKGYHKIGMLRGPREILAYDGTKTTRVLSIDSEEKTQGYLEGLKDHRIQMKASWIRECASYCEGDGYNVMRDWIKKGDLPEAIVCGNDEIAIGSLRAIKEAHINCPKDITIVGFDDIEKAKLITPGLTTIRQPLYQMGRDAVDLLIESVEMPGRDPVQRRYLPELVTRETA